ATNVAISTTATATFSESVQAASIVFALKDAANNAVAGTTAYNDTTHTATFTPSAALAGSTTYTATVSGAKDLAGNAMAAPVTWTFTTFVDTTPPTVTAQSPTPNASGVATGSAASATFSEAVQAATIAFSLTDAANNAVAATVTYNSATN